MTDFLSTEASDFRKGDRVEVHPGTDLWMRGARYGTVVKTTKFVTVKMDAGMTARLRPENVGWAEDSP